MDWMSFFIGLLVGWLTMWLVDLFFWRRRGEPDRQEAEALQLRLERAETRVRELEANEKEWEACRQRLADAEATIEEWKARLPEVEVEADLRVPDLDATVPIPEPVHRENLPKIEGIGPKIADLLYGAGILNFAQLAEASVDRLEEILDRAGPHFRLADPTSWPEQARLAADGKWDELQELQDALSGGRSRPSGDEKPT